MKQKKGFRNKYRQGMPFPERLVKDVRSFAADLASRISNKGKLPVIVAWPDYPSKKSTIYKIARQLKMRLTNKPLSGAAVYLFFEDATEKSHITNNEISSFGKVLNARCADISKRKVDAVLQDVFGFNTFVDPRTFQGTAVEKSDANAMHDGRYVECPLQDLKEGAIYQRVIDNKTEEGFALDYRAAVIGSQIAVVYAKYKKWDVRFTNEVVLSRLLDPLSVFSTMEQANILKFCQKMEVDFCELDILKDNNDGRFYIIDVNTTPYGPPAGLPPIDVATSVALLADAFKQNFVI
jgi:hypothetical protein